MFVICPTTLLLHCLLNPTYSNWQRYPTITSPIYSLTFKFWNHLPPLKKQNTSYRKQKSIHLWCYIISKKDILRIYHLKLSPLWAFSIKRNDTKLTQSPICTGCPTHMIVTLDLHSNTGRYTQWSQSLFHYTNEGSKEQRESWPCLRSHSYEIYDRTIPKSSRKALLQSLLY